MKVKALKDIDDVSFEKECLLRIMVNAETQRRERNCSVEAVALAYKFSVGKLLRKHMLDLGFLPLRAVHNQEIQRQQRSKNNPYP
ncbi:hypothetical protein [Paenibacillus glacialis]|uniref:Uncharacterized protein n=1 Tax=Paenibacillus glacialis TaxID=494026 RepID=A0A168N095_9BACL|nr:hypothetical protein [Paenibacillus glacialis]OAB45246.1 hypothetical protein PGLA_03010 [Paenibacillus glacialis]